MKPRAARAETRNPMTAIPEVVDLVRTFTGAQRKAAHRALLALSRSCRAKAEHAWKTRKPPMAAYWAAWAVNWRHLAALLGRKEAPLPEDPDRAFLLHLVDVVWSDAMESSQVPATWHADNLIYRARRTYPPADLAFRPPPRPDFAKEG